MARGEAKTVVVGVDHSEGAKEALRFALEEAKLRGASVRAVHAWTFVPPGAGFMEAEHTWADVDVSELHGAAEAALESTIAEVSAADTGVTIERRVVEGSPAGVLVDEARDADLLVVGSRGHGGFTGLLLGSVSQQVAHHAACPVVIVRARKD
ncbi:MAG TPA: universal stress protein [Gaiellaceae bacterium]|nr:universal stress protein [Gaiellaceae bacterium]